jgi:hypothetical protein
MSRTYRKVEIHEMEWLYWDWEYQNGGFVKVSVVPTKKDLALVKADGNCIHHYHSKVNHHEWFNRAHRKFRANDKVQQAKVYRAIDYEDVDYDFSRPTEYLKGIWWEIY